MCRTSLRISQLLQIMLHCEVCGTEFKAKYRSQRFCSCACKVTYQTGKPMPDRESEKHWGWKGDKVGREALHNWVQKRKQKPVVCECCGIVPPHDLANISGQYRRDIADFEWLCRRCHMKKDGRLAQAGGHLKKYREYLKKK